ncbi:MAG: prepilin peptidase [Bacillota bacterium]|jgi:leader peptidase (prepilin peptidase)/N-methyltransferase
MIYLVYFLLYALVFFVGSCIGSFLNVIIYRLPLAISVAKGRSFCPHCQTTLSPWELVPIISFLFLGGRCKNCKSKISRRYPLVEIIMGMAALLILMRYGFSILALLYFMVAALLTVIAFIDHYTMEIPNILVLLLLIPAVAVMVFFSQQLISAHIIGFFIIGIPMLVLNMVIADSFGGGDIKLIAVCGLLLGWKSVLLAGFVALLLGGIYGVYLLKLDKNNRKAHFAFGPCLCIGVFISMLFSDKIIAWYFQLFS